MQPEIRTPAVAGRFYPGDENKIRRDLERYLRPVAEAPQTPVAVVAPHAGWMYSGRIAGETYAKVRVPDRVVVLCPNHTGLGVRRAIWSAGFWRFPGQDVPVDQELAERIRDEAGLEDDRIAHLREHAIEVHVPFLRARNPDVSIVPICLAQLSVADCRRIGEGLARAVGDLGSSVLVVASTDMSHYIPADEAKALDALALDRVEAIDPEGLYEVVTREDISMCGYIPTTVTLVAARTLGAARAELVRYGNSGETSGDFDQVVGYAGLIAA